MRPAGRSAEFVASQLASHRITNTNRSASPLAGL